MAVQSAHMPVIDCMLEHGCSMLSAKVGQRRRRCCSCARTWRRAWPGRASQAQRSAARSQGFCGDTPLHMAVGSGHTEVCVWLVQNHADQVRVGDPVADLRLVEGAHVPPRQPRELFPAPTCSGQNQV